MELGELDDADVTVTTDYDTAKAMFVDQDPAVAMQSFMTGKIKVQGDMMKLMAMQTPMPQDDHLAAGRCRDQGDHGAARPSPASLRCWRSRDRSTGRRGDVQ